VFTFVFVALVAFSVFFQPVVVQGKSMLPALQDGQFVLMDRQYYRWNTVRKDDIVVFRRGSDLYVKRVYATAGKTVQIVRSSDGTASLPESLGPPQRIAEMLRDRPDIGRLVAVRVPPRCVFVVGDNVNSSMDSRDFGPIPDKAIMGYVPGPAPGADSVLADTGALRIAHR
jgi:signal peptidase I